MRVSVFACLFFLPLPVSAAFLTEWNFEGGIPGRWEVTGLDRPESREEGLRVSTSTEGRLMRSTADVPHRIDAVFLRMTASQPMEGMLLWHERGTPDASLVTFPFAISPGDKRLIEFNVSPYPQWDPHADKIGLAFPPDANATIHSMQLAGFTSWERFLEGLKTFWTFDRFTPYSINFLWGPLLTFNPISRAHVFDTSPPHARSGVTVFYVILAIIGFFLLVRWIGARGSAAVQKQNIVVLLSTLAVLWIVFDLRMGLEWFNYLSQDIRSYHALSPPERTFRERGNFYDFAESVKPHIRGEDRYIFMAQHRWPFLGAIRYLTFPILPTDPDQRLQGIQNWVVYDRPDIVVNADLRLETEGQVFTRPGKTVFRFDPNSFVFRTE